MPDDIAQLLREAGHEVVRVVDVTDPMAEDREVADLASRSGAVLVTADTDFLRREIFPPRRSRGIVVLKELNKAHDRVLRRLLRVLKADEMGHVLAVVDGRSTRFKP